jgi:ADP-L-glycero-D-manno-heptose 6-epimerase
MIIITGAAGFIGSYLAGFLFSKGYKDLVLVDDFSSEAKRPNFYEKHPSQFVHRDKLYEFIEGNHRYIQFVFHLGARTDTAEKNIELLTQLNPDYTKKVWNQCVEFGLPLVYASSAATYGLGELGFSDADQISQKLKPLNPYGESKQQFDLWALAQARKPFFWAGLKFFNVYGPNEYHKGRMASVPFHLFNTLNAGGKVKLFRSHKEGIADGEQMRDFIYVNDVAKVCLFLMESRKTSGIFNLGTGKARTFLDLAKACHQSFGKPFDIDFIDTPADIRGAYQYFTEAEMAKLKESGYHKAFTPLEVGIESYYAEFLKLGKRF